jgi:hypothetical protein
VCRYVITYRNKETNIYRIKMKLAHSVRTFFVCDVCHSIQMVVGNGYWYTNTTIDRDIISLLDVTRCWKCSMSENGVGIGSTMRYADLSRVMDKIENVCQYPDVVNFDMTNEAGDRDWAIDRVAVRDLNMILNGLDYSYTCSSIRKNGISTPHNDFFRPGYQPSYVPEYYPTIYTCYKYLYCTGCTRVLSIKCMGDVKPMSKNAYKITYKSEMIITQCHGCRERVKVRTIRMSQKKVGDNIVTRKLMTIMPADTEVVWSTDAYQTANPIDIVVPLMDHCTAWSLDPHTSEIIDPYQDFLSSKRMVLAADTGMIAGTDPMLI